MLHDLAGKVNGERERRHADELDRGVAPDHDRPGDHEGDTRPGEWYEADGGEHEQRRTRQQVPRDDGRAVVPRDPGMACDEPERRGSAEHRDPERHRPGRRVAERSAQEPGTGEHDDAEGARAPCVDPQDPAQQAVVTG